MQKVSILSKFEGSIPFLLYQNINKEHIITISKFYLLVCVLLLKKHLLYQYTTLACISGVDLLGKTYRFCVAYDFLSITFNTRLRIKIFIDEISTIPTISNVFINSN